MVYYASNFHLFFYYFIAQADEGISDSVELSFMGKLEKADKKDTEDLRVFESLEQAALDSSFCSESVQL